jgi:hypothetical protein
MTHEQKIALREAVELEALSRCLAHRVSIDPRWQPIVSNLQRAAKLARAFCGQSPQ